MRGAGKARFTYPNAKKTSTGVREDRSRLTNTRGPIRFRGDRSRFTGLSRAARCQTRWARFRGDRSRFTGLLVLVLAGHGSEGSDRGSPHPSAGSIEVHRLFHGAPSRRSRGDRSRVTSQRARVRGPYLWAGFREDRSRVTRNAVCRLHIARGTAWSEGIKGSHGPRLHGGTVSRGSIGFTLRGTAGEASKLTGATRRPGLHGSERIDRGSHR
jgi:hypothetical protein